jgi:hypothetical protein
VSVRPDNTGTATVDSDYYWRPMSSCPIGSKVQLLNLGGVAVYGKVTPRSIHEWKFWAPLPKIPKDSR